MLLWDIIRDWFVINIWGGYASNGTLQYNGFLGHFIFVDNGVGFIDGGTDNIYIPINCFSDDLEINVNYLTIGDWLSTTSTIIVLIALCFFFFLMVRWLFRLTSGLIQGRG